IAMHGHIAQEDWEAALRRIDAILEVNRVLERPAEDIARNRMNRANMLVRMGRFGAAKADLEDCLQVFQNDSAHRAKALSSLADLFDKQDDVAQAVSDLRQSRRLEKGGTAQSG